MNRSALPAGHPVVSGGLALVAIGVMALALDRSVWWLTGRWPVLLAGGLVGSALALAWDARPAPLAVRSPSFGRPGAPPPPVHPVRPAQRGTGPRLAVESLSLPKIGAGPGECEDAFACAEVGGVYAVADGASDSFEARAWAQILVDQFVASAPGALRAGEISDWLERARRSWRAHLAPAGAPPGPNGGWWLDGPRERGAFATLLGVRVVTDGGSLGWEATAVGDSCLVQLRGDRCIATFPLDAGSQFTNSPPLLASVAPTGTAGSSGELARFRWAAGDLGPEDNLLLMTDALAEWALSEGPTATHMLATAAGEQIEGVLTAERARGAMANDDLTLLRLSVVA